MAANLQVTSASPSEEAIFNLLKATLEYPTSSPAKAKRLVDDIIFVCTSSEEPPSWEIWPMVIALVSCIPSGHEWQTSLIEALHLIRQLDDSIAIDSNGKSLNQLPDLSITIAEFWNGWENPSTLASSTPLEPDQLDDMLKKWKNVNSFFARVTRDDFVMMLDLGIDQLFDLLEKPAADQGPVTSCYIWVATEWIIHCGRLIFEIITSPDQSKVSPEVLKRGSLCKDMPLQGVQRWEFWKERLSEFNGDSLTTFRIQEAMKAMEDVEKQMRQQP